jgi:phospholipase/carboxylesterase
VPGLPQQGGTRKYPCMTVAWSRPESGRAGTHLLVMIHGYGSDEARMSAIFNSLPDGTTGVAIRGPKDIGGSYGWFLLDPLLAHDFGEVLSAVTEVFAWLDRTTAAGSFTSVSLLGFSQGMAMATTMLRLRPAAFRAAVGLSGFVLDSELLAATEPLERKVPFFWGRDANDPVIHPRAIDYTQEWLAANVALTARTYPGMGHRLGARELRDVRIFLKHYLADR